MKILNYINGSYCEPLSGAWLDNYNPSEGIYAQIANSNAQDVAKAFEAAKAAFPGWSQTPSNSVADFAKIADHRKKLRPTGTGRIHGQRKTRELGQK